MSMPSAPQLGALQGEFRMRRRSKWAGIVLCAFFILLGVMGLAVLFSPGLSEGSRSASPDVSVALGTALCLGIGACFLWVMIGQRGVRLQLFEEGLAYSRRGETQIFRWGEIDEFFAELTDVSVNMIPAGRRARYTLRKATGEKIVFTNDLEGAERVADRVANETFSQMLPHAVDTLAGGGQVSFGKLGVTREGLSAKGKRLTWAEMKGITVEQGVIKVEQKNARSAWAKVAYSQVPNARVFLALVDRML